MKKGTAIIERVHHPVTWQVFRNLLVAVFKGGATVFFLAWCGAGVRLRRLKL